MEFLLANHPLDCPICDQGGECDLQDQVSPILIRFDEYALSARIVPTCSPSVSPVPIYHPTFTSCTGHAHLYSLAPPPLITPLPHCIRRCSMALTGRATTRSSAACLIRTWGHS
jgi:hypothetical protein